MSPTKAPIIGIIGGIGSGKTAVAKELGKHFLVHHLDADSAGHRALDDDVIKAELAKQLGEQILNSDGNIIRQEIANVVFGESPEQVAARKKLEAILHPQIRKLLEAELVNAIENGAELIILDAALLLEAGWVSLCDALIFLETPEELRLQRVQQRGWSEDEFQRREASQLPLEVKKEAADFAVDNSQPLATVGKLVADYIHQEIIGRKH